ncbi:MAG: IS982 family transposase [Phocaeicola sp.]
MKKLYTLLICSILETAKPLIHSQYMHNLYTIFGKILRICKQFGDNLINEKGNIPRPDVVPKFSDIEVIALSLTSEAMGIESESNLFIRLSEYKNDMPNLFSRRQYNDRRKTTSTLYNSIRKRIAETIDGGEEYFCIDSKPIEVCRVARGKRCKMGINDYHKAPSFGYCASQKSYYYGYKLHAICGLSGVIHSFDLTKASVHDINYLKDIKHEYRDCSILGDKGYISKNVQLDLFETANIKLEVPHRLNQKDWSPIFIPFAKARKRIETDFSQLCDQFMIVRNYGKETVGLFTRILGKISAFTILQYTNHINNKPIGGVKYALI